MGVDDEVTQNGSMMFAVSGDGKSLATTPLVRRGDPARALSVDVTGIATLLLRVIDGGDGRNHDHADWADAHLTCK